MKKKIAVLLALVMVIGLGVVGIREKAYAREAQMYIIPPEDVKKEQEIKVKVVLDSDVNLYSIDSYVSYDADLLEFVPENDIVTGANGTLEIKDVFGQETKHKEYELTFKTLDIGNAYVNLTDVYLIDYENLDYITVTPSDYSFDISVNEQVAEDARLSDLIVAPGDLTEAFDANKLEYEMHVGLDVDSIGISAIAMNEDSVVDVDMPDALVEGDNWIRICVTALSGNVNTYTIHVIKAQWPEETTTEEETSEASTQEVMPEETTEVSEETTTQMSETTQASTEEITTEPIQ